VEVRVPSDAAGRRFPAEERGGAGPRSCAAPSKGSAALLDFEDGEPAAEAIRALPRVAVGGCPSQAGGYPVEVGFASAGRCCGCRGFPAGPDLSLAPAEQA
jgi:hypothetical protein